MSFDELIQQLTSAGSTANDSYWVQNLGSFIEETMLVNGEIVTYWVVDTGSGGGSLSGIWVDANFWDDNDSWSE